MWGYLGLATVVVGLIIVVAILSHNLRKVRKPHELADRADAIFGRMLHPRSASLEDVDILTDKTRDQIQKWIKDYHEEIF